MKNSKTQGLKRSSDFSLLKSDGRKLRVCSWLLISHKKTDLGCLRYGITVPKKVGSAVLRNKIKRRVRDFFQKSFKTSTYSLDINLVFFPAPENFYQDMTSDGFMEQMQKIKHHLEKTYSKGIIQTKSTRTGL